MSVPQVVAQIHELNGKTVRVAGYLGECAGYSCNLYVDRAGRDAHQNWVRAVVEYSRLGTHDKDATFPAAPPEPKLGIGGLSEFDRKAAPFQNSFVVITGKVSDKCRGPSRQPGCTDRSDIEPADIASRKEL